MVSRTFPGKTGMRAHLDVGRPRTVFVMSTRPGGRGQHERVSQEAVARRLAGLLGWDYGGELRPGQAPPADAYLIPDETLCRDQAQAMGLPLDGEQDLFGGLVPHAFVASKVITHGLFKTGSPAPPGWSQAMAGQLGDSVLPGWSVFDPAQVEAAGLDLLGRGGRIRLKCAQDRGGNGQYLVADRQQLREVAACLDPTGIGEHGLVLEQNLEDALTLSIGQIQVGRHRLSYLGEQHQVTDRSGVEVYAGSRLRVVRGGMEDLQPLAENAIQASAIEQARRYDAAVGSTYPGFFASRRNYDLVAGRAPDGRLRCAVLEQSWRLGGASPAEIRALEYFLSSPGSAAVEASCHESHDPDQQPPADAWVLFQDPHAAQGPVLKYATVGGL
jgi:hypothetical protein